MAFVDPICLERKVIVEINGGQHIEQMEADFHRTAFFQSQSFTVIRFWNNDVLIKIESVLEAILAAPKSPSPQPSPTGGEGVIPRAQSLDTRKKRCVLVAHDAKLV